MRLSPSVKEKFNYGTLIFKKIYDQRASAERVFSGLLAIAMQKPTVIGLKATQNHCTICPYYYIVSGSDSSSNGL